MEVFLYLLDMYIDFQFILSSCGCIGIKCQCMVGVGLPLPRRTKSFVPILYLPPDHSREYHCSICTIKTGIIGTM